MRSITIKANSAQTASRYCRLLNVEL